MNSLRLPFISPNWVKGEAPAKMRTGTLALETLWTAPASDWVPHSTWTMTAWARPETWACPCAAVSATISFGQVMTLGSRWPLARASAKASIMEGWSLPKLQKR